MANDKNIQTFNEVQLAKILNNQISFLKSIHPYLIENGYHKECMELRPIERVKGPYIKSFNLWRFDDKGIEEYKKFLQKINGQPLCLYYSGYTFDCDKIVYKPDGSTYEKGKINKDNALYTQILPMDFDNICFDDYIKYMDKLKSLNIEYISIFTGHGYQTIILLKERVYNKDLYNLFTNLLLSKGWPVDSKIIDSARILRMPYSFNCKCFDVNDKSYNPDDPEPIPVKIIDNTTKRFDLDYVLSSIFSLPTINKDNENIYLQLKNNLNIQSNNVTNNAIDIINDNINKPGDFIIVKSIRELYSMLDFDKLPDAVQAMLIETTAGYRNSVMLFLIPFFRNKLGYSLDNLIEIFKVWGTRCVPVLDSDYVISEVKRIYALNYKGTGAYTTELAQQFGYIKFDEYKRDNKVIISNDFIEYYSALSDAAIKIYLMLKLYEKLDNIKDWTMVDILKAACIPERTFFRHIDELVNLGFINKRKCFKGDNGYFYCLNPYYDKSKGFTIFDTGTLENMVYNRNRVLNNAELKTYTYLCRMIGSSNEYCYASQTYLGNAIGKARNSISRITDSLVLKKYIKKDTYIKDHKEHCIYTLNY